MAKWLTRRSAKPVYEGSIPSRCSNHPSPADRLQRSPADTRYLGLVKLGPSWVRDCAGCSEPGTEEPASRNYLAGRFWSFADASRRLPCHAPGSPAADTLTA